MINLMNTNFQLIKVWQIVIMDNHFSMGLALSSFIAH